MFFGTTPSVVGQYIAQCLKDAKPKRVYVPFSGNFVIEQLAANNIKDVEIHATDVSLYSRAIGFGVTGCEWGCTLKEQWKAFYPVIGANESPIGIAVAVIFLTEAAKAIQKSDVAYYDGLRRDSIANQERYYQKILQKLEIIKTSLKNMKFYGVDAMKITPDCKKGDFVVFDPPVLLGDYEKMFAAVEKMFDYPSEGYTEMTREVTNAELERLSGVGCNVIYRTNNPLPEEEMPKGYEMVYKHGYKWDAAYCLYSNKKDLRRHVGRYDPLKEEAKVYPVIMPEDTITMESKIQVIPTTGNIGNHYRLMWVKKAQMTDGGNPYLVLADGNIIGLLQVQSGLKFGTDLIPIFSDPAAPYSRYKRLSKLIVALCSTQEFLKHLNELFLWEHVGFTTRVFTNEAVSMKYRDLFELVERKDAEGSHYKNTLIYQNKKKLFKTYQDALNWWVKKHSGHLNNTIG